MSDHQAQETPIVVYVVQTVSVLTAASYALQALGALTLFGKVSIVAILCTVAICLLTSGLSLSVWRGVGSRRSISRRYVLNYLWFMVLIYPAMAIMRSLGAFAPNPRLADTELLGAALGDMARYAIFLGLIIWVGRSAEFKKHLSVGPAQPGDPVRTDPI